MREEWPECGEVGEDVDAGYIGICVPEIPRDTSMEQIDKEQWAGAASLVAIVASNTERIRVGINCEEIHTIWLNASYVLQRHGAVSTIHVHSCTAILGVKHIFTLNHWKAHLFASYYPCCWALGELQPFSASL